MSKSKRKRNKGFLWLPPRGEDLQKAIQVAIGSEAWKRAKIEERAKIMAIVDETIDAIVDEIMGAIEEVNRE